MEKILIVNDEITKVENLCSALSDLPFEITTTQDTKEGLLFFRTARPFLIILDLKHSADSGIAFVEQLIKQEETTKGLYYDYFTPTENPDLQSHTLRSENFYVIVLTDNPSKATMHRYSKMGVDYLLNKPVHLYTLEGIINTIFRLKTTRDELSEKFAPILNLVPNKRP